MCIQRIRKKVSVPRQTKIDWIFCLESLHNIFFRYVRKMYDFLFNSISIRRSVVVIVGNENERKFSMTLKICMKILIEKLKFVPRKTTKGGISLLIHFFFIK